MQRACLDVIAVAANDTYCWLLLGFRFLSAAVRL